MSENPFIPGSKWKCVSTWSEYDQEDYCNPSHDLRQGKVYEVKETEVHILPYIQESARKFYLTVENLDMFEKVGEETLTLSHEDVLNQILSCNPCAKTGTYLVDTCCSSYEIVATSSEEGKYEIHSMRKV